MGIRTVAVAFPTPPGIGGLGQLAHDVIADLMASQVSVLAIGPTAAGSVAYRGIDWRVPPDFIPNWRKRWTTLRWNSGKLEELLNARRSRWTAREIERSPAQALYIFSQIALDSLRWARTREVLTVLDSPTGHIRHFRETGVREARRWGAEPYKDHPSARMVSRVELEYELADRIRVASNWSRDTLVAHGVRAEKIRVVGYRTDVVRFSPPLTPRPTDGPMRICMVAGITLHKGFVYLLNAIRKVGAKHVRLELVGATGSRACRQLLAREAAHLDIHAETLPDVSVAYHRAELLVHPSLHDGYGLVVGEAMATGLPVIVSNTCGAASLVQPGVTGWIVPAADVDSLAAALQDALENRVRLATMGAAARTELVNRALHDQYHRSAANSVFD